jgi:ABC-2 type transport system ATP-binding protein
VGGALAAAEPAIRVDDLRKSYGNVEAVRGLSFQVARGEVFGLLGPNGAGKTTTVEILEGYRGRSSGEVAVLGHDPASRERRLQQRVGIVLQEAGFYPRVTVDEAVRHFASLYEQPRDAAETIELVGLEGREGIRTADLSGGQRRRLDLALALVGDPELVFLDEPTTGFDPAARRTAWDAVRRLGDLGKTVLLTTHYLDEAQALADRVAIVKDGLIVAEGPPGELGGGGARYVVAYESNGRRVHHETDDPTDLLHRLTSDAIRRGERLEGLTVTQPSLEEVYLELTLEDDRPVAAANGGRPPARRGGPGNRR